ncbi:Importin subunit beta-5 [Colletotrichum musicola]|uniref:Importin subunit beta-5 n=2 Tax=Colletotrichum orchidearum species complex TaxID=2707337 RepID=A0A8H6NU53_9PEZI|nr:Importin subunit beta-5 [Colletotrichum sojae]KAF6842602.1 Importin subunit beta-5 [Colletotrichum musicola]
MEEQLVSLLASTQSSEQGPRQQAEIELKRARENPAYPTSLANIANHASVDTGIRQAALSALRLFIERNWSPEDRDASEPLVEISDTARDQLRNTLLEIALSNEDKRRVKIAASYAIGKIASADFPERWPQLLPTVLGVIPTSTDVQLHGALRVLGDIIEESLSEDQFFTMARDIVKAVTSVALNEGRKPNLRALAISVFRSCFDLMDIVKEDHKKEVRAFAEDALKDWYPFIDQVLKTRLPDAGPNELTSGQPESWNHIIALKLQVVKTLLKVKSVFPHLLLPQSTSLFTAIWEELSLLQKPHEDLYIGHEAQGRLEDADGLPYTLDFLILEELDFLNQCFRAPPVQAELEAQLSAHASPQETPWMVEVMKMVVGYSRISREEEELWDIDCSLYLAEETSVTANYTARTASGDLLIKLGEWYSQKAVDGLFGYTKTLFPGDGSTWRSQEASLYLFNMLLSDFQDMEKPIPDAVSEAYLGLVDFAVNQSEQPLLRARGYLVGGTLARGFATPPALLDRIIQCITSEESEVVQVACIKAVEGFVRSGRVAADRQVPIINAIAQYMQSKDPNEMEDADELLVTLAESLRAAIDIDTRIALSPDVSSVDLLFMVAKLGASNFQATMLICEAFEEIVRTLSDTASYTALCAKILPTLTAAFNTANVTQDDPLVTVATELLTALVEHGSEPLPAGFVAATLPKLNRLLMESNEGEVLRPGAESVKYLLMHDHHQVFGWHDENGRSGLEVCLHIIDRLLGPSIEDNSASEVGGLAAELVEKAGQERLGPFLPQLLQAVATRLASAEAPAFIQSLILVFARLSLVGAHDVVEFLSQIPIHGNTGLQVVLSKWLENSVSFAGYDEIRQNVIALSKLYSLNDPRLAQTMVKGDLVINNNDGRIMTRSRAKANPDQYTVIPASLKILKVLIEELLSASGVSAAANAAAVAAAADFADEENDDDGWEDEPDTLDLSLGGTKADLMSSYIDAGARQRDDETQAYLTEFFLRAARENVANFQEWYGMLTEEERGKLNDLANASGQ